MTSTDRPNNCPICGHLQFRQNDRWATDGRDGANPTGRIDGGDGRPLTVHACCRREAERLVDSWIDDTNVTADGVWSWKSNGAVLMDDTMRLLVALRCVSEFDLAPTARARAAEVAEFVAAYRAQARPLEGEALAEARAAFGPGAVVVDVVSGIRTTL